MTVGTWHRRATDGGVAGELRWAQWASVVPTKGGFVKHDYDHHMKNMLKENQKMCRDLQ